MLEPSFNFFSWGEYFAVSLFLNDAHLVNGAHLIKMHTAFLAVALINIHLKRLLGWAGILLDGGQRNDRQLLAIVLHNIAPVGSAHFFCVAATQMYINELVDSRVDLQIEEYAYEQIQEKIL